MKSTYQFYFGAILLSMSQAVMFQGESLISADPTCEERGQRVTDLAKTHCDYFRAFEDASGYQTCLDNCQSGDPEGFGSCESRCEARKELVEDDLEKIEDCESFAQ